MKTVKTGVKKAVAKAGKKGGIVATRRSCDVKGTGLSHYILMDNRKK